MNRASRLRAETGLRLGAALVATSFTSTKDRSCRSVLFFLAHKPRKQNLRDFFAIWEGLLNPDGLRFARAWIDAAWKTIRSTFYGGLVLSATDQANSGESGMAVTDERDKRTYACVPQHRGRYAGRNRIKVAGQESKAEGPRQNGHLRSKRGDQGLRRLSAAVELHNYRRTWRRLVPWEGNTMKSNALAVQSILEMTENLANGCPVSGHSPSSHARIRALRIEKRLAWLMTSRRCTILLTVAVLMLLVGCSIWEQLLGQREAAVRRFDSTKSMELPSTVAEARSRRFRRRFHLFVPEASRARSAAICRCRHSTLHISLRCAMATILIKPNRVKSLVDQVPYEDFALV